MSRILIPEVSYKQNIHYLCTYIPLYHRRIYFTGSTIFLFPTSSFLFKWKRHLHLIQWMKATARRFVFSFAFFYYLVCSYKYYQELYCKLYICIRDNFLNKCLFSTLFLMSAIIPITNNIYAFIFSSTLYPAHRRLGRGNLET